MAINVLIDTCILKKLVSRTEFSGYLKQIIAWHKSGEIKIFCPKTLLLEWQDHRLKEMQAINVIIKEHAHKIKMSNLFEVPIDIGDAQFSAADKMLRSQIDAIDILLAESVQVVDEPGAGKMWEHKNSKKAPFRVKSNSENDAMILFATFEELINQKESELYFFSSNHTDYSSQGHKDQIHPDIQESYPNIKVKYFHDHAVGIDALIQLGLTSTKKSIRTQKAGKVLIEVDFRLPLIEQIYQYLDRRFDDIRVLPKELFVMHYPFIIGDFSKVRSEPFTLPTDNKEIHELFLQLTKQVPAQIANESTLIAGENVSIDQKLKAIVQVLRSCFVHRLTYNYKQVDVPIIKGEICLCANCMFKRSEFVEAIRLVTANIESEQQSLKDAYLNYQLGNIMVAIRILKNVSSKAESERKWLSFYIANYNLSLIGRMHRFSSEERESQWVKELDNIVMEDIYIFSRSQSTDDILDYLKEANFISKATDKANELTIKIKNDHLDGIHGWNSYTRELLDLYFETIGFMENNYIMLDYFSDVNTLTYHFVDGILASYSCHGELGGKLLHFTDPIVGHIVNHGKSDDIIKCRNRYDILNAAFVFEGSQSMLVRNLIRLLDSYLGIKKCFSETEHSSQHFFWKRFRNQFHNSLTLAAILDIPKVDVNIICESLLPFLKVEQHFQEYEIAKTVAYFIQNNARLIEKKFLEEFLVHAYTGENVQRDVFIHTISNVSKIEDLELKLNKDQWTEIQTRYLVNTEINDQSTLVSEICCLYDFLKAKKYKDEIGKFMTDYLKHSYNSEVYYTAVIHKLIKPTRKLDALYEMEMINKANEGRKPRIFEKSYYTSSTLDQYINYKFCFGKPFDSRFVNAVMDLDPYYHWILDLDGFDYEDFNTDWLFNHLTKYYREKFRNSTVLQYYLRKKSLKSKDSRISKFYIDLYTDPPY